MIARFGLLTRHPALSPQAFDEHWRDRHGPLAARFPGLRAYFQHLVVMRGSPIGAGIPALSDLDGMSELHFNSLDAMKSAVDSAAFRDVLPDEASFLRDLRLVACDHQQVRPANADLEVGSIILIRARSGPTHAGIWPIHRENGDAEFRNVVVERYVRRQTGLDLREAVPLDALMQLRFATVDRAAAYMVGLATEKGRRPIDAEVFETRTRRIV